MASRDALAYVSVGLDFLFPRHRPERALDAVKFRVTHWDLALLQPLKTVDKWFNYG